jgi:membrane protease YdiL (CAAX protease family)
LSRIISVTLRFYITVFLIVGRENLKIAEFSVSVNFVLALAVSLINPLFEEVFVLGYIFDRLNSYNFWLLLLLSVLIRTSYHLYQGWIGLISLVPVGLLYAFAYYRAKNLWPVYLAHFILDLTALATHS